MKWGLMGVAFFQLALFILNISAAFNFQNDPSLAEVLMMAGVIAIMNGLVPILRSKRLDTLMKRKLALLILVGFGIQLIALVLDGSGPDRFIDDVNMYEVSSYKLFWFGEFVGLVGIAISYWNHVVVIPIKKWLTAEVS